MIALGPEPEGQLLRPADIFAWVRGLGEKEWTKLRPHLTPVPLLGCKRPYYAKEEIRAKVVAPILKAETNNQKNLKP